MTISAKLKSVLETISDGYWEWDLRGDRQTKSLSDSFKSMLGYNADEIPDTLEAWKKLPGILFVSEYPPDQAMYRHHFYRRNQLIAALCQCLLVVEAKEKSGTMITAQYAMELGKDVVTVPGSVLDPAFSGNNQSNKAV